MKLTRLQKMKDQSYGAIEKTATQHPAIEKVAKRADKQRDTLKEFGTQLAPPFDWVAIDGGGHLIHLGAKDTKIDNFVSILNV